MRLQKQNEQCHALQIRHLCLPCYFLGLVAPARARYFVCAIRIPLQLELSTTYGRAEVARRDETLEHIQRIAERVGYEQATIAAAQAILMRLRDLAADREVGRFHKIWPMFYTFIEWLETAVPSADQSYRDMEHRTSPSAPERYLSCGGGCRNDVLPPVFRAEKQLPMKIGGYAR